MAVWSLVVVGRVLTDGHHHLMASGGSASRLILSLRVNTRLSLNGPYYSSEARLKDIKKKKKDFKISINKKTER